MLTLHPGQEVRLGSRLRVVSREDQGVVSIPPGERLMITENKDPNGYVIAEWNSRELYIFKQDLLKVVWDAGRVGSYATA